MIGQRYCAYNQIFNLTGVERFDKRAPIFRKWHPSPCGRACGVGTESPDAPPARAADSTLGSLLQLPGEFGTCEQQDPCFSFYLFSSASAMREPCRKRGTFSPNGARCVLSRVLRSERSLRGQS